MAKFVLSAFADEMSPLLDEQLAFLREQGIGLIELRNVDGKNCAQLTLEEADAIRAKLDAAGIELSALGSPYGKYPLDQPFEEHLAAFEHGLELCKRLRCRRIRMFSFYPPKGADVSAWRDEALHRLGVMLDLAQKAGVELVHENEKDIYGDVTERCVDLLEYFEGRMGFVFDPANFVQCGVDTLAAYEALKDKITYLHIKDALVADGAVVAPGHGDGQVAKLLALVDAAREDNVILTVEPHLTVFDGLGKLQSEELVHHESYPNKKTAFCAALDALRGILAGI